MLHLLGDTLMYTYQKNKKFSLAPFEVKRPSLFNFATVKMNTSSTKVADQIHKVSCAKNKPKKHFENYNIDSFLLKNSSSCT